MNQDPEPTLVSQPPPTVRRVPPLVEELCSLLEDIVDTLPSATRDGFREICARLDRPTRA